MGFFDWFRKPKPEHASEEESFVRDIEARARAIPGMLKISRDPKEPMGLLVETAGGRGSAFLGNLFAETRALDAATRERQIARHLKMWAQPVREVTWEEAQSSLMVTLRGPLRDLPPDALPAAYEVAPGLRAHLVVDRETTLMLVQTKQLREWGVSLDDALGLGRERLAQAPRTAVLHDEARRIWRVATHDSYEAARLLVPGFLAEFVARVSGRPIATIPTRDLAFIAGDADPEVVVHMCELAEQEFKQSPRGVSAAVYAHDDTGALVRYFRAGSDAAARRVRTAHVRTEGTWYHQQKADLEARFEASGAEVCMGSFIGIEHPVHGAQSICTWEPGVEALLPKTDLVATGTPDDVVVAPWEEVERVAGPKLVREVDFFPPRWRTMGALSVAQLETLRGLAFDPSR